ncbi:YbaK/EbsC family protein [Rathayibacter tritici]|uniref:Aminoacyl-tRNA deacylase n=1 Tax=Rathayibacter tritici TaxID=33888 RepID=A0A169BV55_9MICO|nr:YbaK/EbsC family protein [Rathayibacter tritici]AND15855.1 aminoacyl-tRNA deacylase [Rathayibacter tritici]PPF27224.1 YbaK/EbsC family protein [Rathayibacter tritici]PPF66589.1 YbaK/EbsC family protein [Rathayibacter tritici]PPG06149.1 YbaK/EbsC family protein [Rathayibacter tritici]PPI15616.1 YbaK/EbsC family protein [Rathayibacter tritici]
MSGRSHPAVDRVLADLDRRGVQLCVRWLDEAASTAALAAAALDVEVGQIANSLVFLLDGAPSLVLTSGGHRVETEWLGEQLGGVIGRASASDVRAATGQVIGGVAPVGHPAPLRTVVDTALASSPAVWAAAGHPQTVYPTSFDEFVRVTGGEARAVVPPDARQ